MFRLPRNSYEFNTDPNKGIDYILSAIRGLQSGWVSQIIAGTNVTISPVSGTGAVTINASGGGSIPTLDQVTTAGNTVSNNGITITKSIGTTLTLNPNNSDNAIQINNNGYIKFGLNSYMRGFSTTFAVLDSSYTPKFSLNWGGGASHINTGGNLLIGTTTDAGYKLDVNGTLRTTGGITTDSGIVGPGAFNIYSQYSNRGRIDLWSSNASATTPQIQLLTDGGIRMSVTKEGNVGIGTSNPLHNLHVSGNVLIGNYGASTSLLRFANVSNDSNSAYIGRTVATQFEINAGSVSSFRIQIPAGSDTFPLTLYGNGVNTAQFYRNQRTRFGGSLSTNPSSIVEIIGSGTTSSTTSLIVANSSAVASLVVNDAGNVLIGTTTDAGYKLDVNGSARSNALYVQNGIGTYGAMIGTTSRYGYTPLTVATPAGSLSFGTVAHFEQSRSETTYLGNYDKPTITLANVDTTVDTWTTIQFSKRSDTALATAGIGVQYRSSQNSDLAFFTRGSNTFSEKMRITSGGNVGIGTTAPSSKLQLGEDASTLGSNVLTMYRGGSTGQYTTIENQGGTVYKSYGVGGHVFYHDPAQEAMRVAATTGNLLVGTATDAGYRLDVQGGDARFAQNVEAASYSVAGNAGYSGIVNFPGNPPGSQNLEFLQGILINVF